MTWEIEWAPSALRDFKRLDKPVVKRIITSLKRFAETGHGDVKKLKASEEYRLRVGKWRVRFTLDLDEGSLLVVHVLARGEAYR